jgi:beta-N-acetylhexosaminidase
MGSDLAEVGINLDLAPVADINSNPLNPVIGVRSFGSDSELVGRHVRAFVSGMQGCGVAACAKHFPGLGSASISTDLRPHVDATVRDREVAAFRAAVRGGIPCVMTSHAFYPTLGGRFRASLQPATYRLLRSLGFDGVAITDSLSLVRSAPVERWAPQAVRAGADLVLFTSPAHARRAVRALLPLARRGELDAHVARVLRFRERYGR